MPPIRKRIEPYWKSPDGHHVLYCADCLDILPTLGKVDAVITDPPYGMEFRSNHRKDKHDSIVGDCNEHLLQWSCEIPVLHSRYVFLRWDNISSIPKPKSLITWVKNNWSMGDLEHEHARQTECIAFWPGEFHKWYGPRPTDMVTSPRSGNELHPTEKPLELMVKITEWATGTVLDPFTGSGTTGVACIRTGRKFIGIEIEKGYCDIAVKRMTEEWERMERLRLAEEKSKARLKSSLFED